MTEDLEALKTLLMLRPMARVNITHTDQGFLAEYVEGDYAKAQAIGFQDLTDALHWLDVTVREHIEEMTT